MNSSENPNPFYSVPILGTHGILCIFGVFGNLWVLLTFLRYPQLRKIECLYLIGGLAVHDFFTGIGGIIYNGSQTLGLLGIISYTKGSCLAACYVQVSSLMGGQVMTLSIAYDRFLAFRYLADYKKRKHKQFAKKCFLCSFLFGYCNAALLFVGVDFTAVPLYCNVAGSMLMWYGYYWTVLIIVIGVAVFVLYIRTLRMMDELSGSIQGTHRDKAIERKIKMTKTVSNVLGIYTAFWLIPNFSFIIANLVGAGLWFNTKADTAVSVGAYITAASNVAIYAAKHGVFRQFLIAFLQGKKPGTVQPMSQTATRRNVLKPKVQIVSAGQVVVNVASSAVRHLK